MAELNHRVKNTLAIVQAIGMQTATLSGEGREFTRKFAMRLQALARTHDLLTERAWDGIALRDLIGAELATLPESARVSVSGVTVRLPAETAVSIGLVVHELTTNAVKHGCLAEGGGCLDIAWAVDEGSPPILRFEWSECCPQPIKSTGKAGFGTRLITRTVAKLGTGTSELRETGLLFRMTMELPDDSDVTRAA
jgi:two-component sensor histidine kinase